jgi:hypothetical protein
MKPLAGSEQRVLLGINRWLSEAYHATQQQNQGWIDLHRQMEAIIGRAQERDLKFAALGGTATAGEAVAILKRHGEPLGVSDEVLEMIVEVPPEG